MKRFGLNGATTGEHVDIETDIRVAGEAGYQAVELRDTKIERYLGSGGTLAALRGRLRDAGVEVLSINALEDSTLRTGARLEEILARCRVFCEWARALDAPYVVAVPSFLAPGEAGSLDSMDAGMRSQTGASLAAMAGVAKPFGVKVGFEFLGFRTCSVNTLRVARDILDEVGDPTAGLVIDTFHFYAGGSRLEDLDGLDAARVFVVHVDDAEPGDPAGLGDSHRLLPGEGVIPLKAMITRLEEAGYRGTYSLELFRPEYWAWPPAEIARRGLDSMVRLFT
ncbi:MAG: sugar phosphate isomerase/epimerase [Armatimonadetes bacterium]|nr:sugar phosphate isomerase/epimerase [Armatimonadota bacterium]